jgi:hypothetical protein
MNQNATQALLSIARLTGKQPRNWEERNYVNRTLDEVKDIYCDWEYKLSLDSFLARFVDSGADAYGESDFTKKWEGQGSDWGYIALLKEPKDEAGALVEIGLMDKDSTALSLSDYRCILRYPVTHGGQIDKNRPCEHYGLSNEGGTALLPLSVLSFAELMSTLCELETNIFLNDDRQKRPLDEQM